MSKARCRNAPRVERREAPLPNLTGGR
ncbi:MAG: hypothetical protein QOD40_429, partial [Alphaproteobacteria bacterium]|nr:hypothetical protein [Alphaproteobacteria bacterium]